MPRFYRTRKPAWELRAGDIIERVEGGKEENQPIRNVRRHYFTGEFEGQIHQNAPHVTIEFIDPPATYLTVPGDRAFTIIRERERAA